MHTFLKASHLGTSHFLPLGPLGICTHISLHSRGARHTPGASRRYLHTLAWRPSSKRPLINNSSRTNSTTMNGSNAQYLSIVPTLIGCSQPSLTLLSMVSNLLSCSLSLRNSLCLPERLLYPLTLPFQHHTASNIFSNEN